MILKLLEVVLDGARYAKDPKNGLKITLVRKNLIIYRHGELKLWLDLGKKTIEKWSIGTQAEAKAFNSVLLKVDITDYKFMRSNGTTILLKNGQHYGLSGGDTSPEGSSSPA